MDFPTHYFEHQLIFGNTVGILCGEPDLLYMQILWSCFEMQIILKLISL